MSKRPRQPHAVWTSKQARQPVLRSVFQEGQTADYVLVVMKRSGRRHKCRPVMVNYDELKDKPPALQRKLARVRWYLDDVTLTFGIGPGPEGMAFRVVEVGPPEDPPERRIKVQLGGDDIDAEDRDTSN